MRSIEVKAAVILAFLFLILMRLVWMDTRSYIIVYAPENHRSVFDGGVCQKDPIDIARSNGPSARPGPGNSILYQTMLNFSCRGSSFSESSFVRYNQGLLVLTVLACMILARITTRSWIVALFVGLALLSRGRLIASSGQISGDHLIMVGVATWAMFIGHWIRSGSRLILAMIFASLIWLCELEPSFFTLAFIPLIYSYSVRTRYFENRQVVRDRILFWPSLQNFLELQNFEIARGERSVGGIFRPLPQTVSKPLREDRNYSRFLKDFIFGTAVLLVTLVLLAVLKDQFSRSIVLHLSRLNLWSQLFFMPIDRDIVLSLVTIGTALSIHTFVLPALRGINYSIVLGVVLSALGVMIVDHIYLPVEATGFWLSGQVILWWEPLILGLGVLGFYHCVITLLNRLWKRFRFSNTSVE